MPSFRLIDDYDELLDPAKPYTGAVLFLPVPPRDEKTKKETVQQRFIRHAKAFSMDWKAGKVGNSKKHASYLAIIAMGSNVVPFLLQDFLENNLFWLPALRILTRQDPANGSADSNVQYAAWRAWAMEHNITLD